MKNKKVQCLHKSITVVQIEEDSDLVQDGGGKKERKGYIYNKILIDRLNIKDDNN